MRTLQSMLLAGGLWLSSAPALADGIATVNFQTAIDQVAEGARVRAELNALTDQKQGEVTDLANQLQTKGQAFQTAVSTYQSQVQMNILTDDARAQREQELGVMQNELMQLEQEYNQKAMQAEREVQQVYAEKMEAIIGKMRTVSQAIAKEKGFDLVFEVTEGGLVYQADTVPDITADVIKRYDGG